MALLSPNWPRHQQMLKLFILPQQLDVLLYLNLELRTYSWAWFEEADGVENVDRYRPGSYHPALVGDNLTTTHVLYLGHGANSTVWLAQNTLIEVGIPRIGDTHGQSHEDHQ